MNREAAELISDLAGGPEMGYLVIPDYSGQCALLAPCSFTQLMACVLTVFQAEVLDGTYREDEDALKKLAQVEFPRDFYVDNLGESIIVY